MRWHNLNELKVMVCKIRVNEHDAFLLKWPELAASRAIIAKYKLTNILYISQRAAENKNIYNEARTFIQFRSDFSV